MGFASGDLDTAITASPMLRVSKRLSANVFHGPEIEAGTSAADAAHTVDARLLRGEITSSTRGVGAVDHERVADAFTAPADDLERYHDA
jgi:hypothetical protein